MSLATLVSTPNLAKAWLQPNEPMKTFLLEKMVNPVFYLCVICWLTVFFGTPFLVSEYTCVVGIALVGAALSSHFTYFVTPVGKEIMRKHHSPVAIKLAQGFLVVDFALGMLILVM